MLPVARCLKHDSESSKHSYALASDGICFFHVPAALRVRCLFLLKERAWSRRATKGNGCPTYRKGGPSEVRLVVTLDDRGVLRPNRSPEQSLEHGFKRDTDDEGDACRIPITFGPPGACGDGGEGVQPCTKESPHRGCRRAFIGGSFLVDSRMLLFLADVSSSACINLMGHTGTTFGLGKLRMTLIILSTLMQG